MPKAPKALLFDVGNVLVRLKMEFFFAKLYAACPRLDPETMHAELKRPEGPHIAYERGQIGAKEFHAALQERYGLNWDFETWLEHWLDFFLPNRPMEILIAKVKDQVRLWALSNTNADHYALFLRDYRLFDAFENVLGSHQLGLRKPEPAIFVEALKRMKMDPEEIIYIDDLSDNIEEGKRHGLRGFCYRFNDLDLKAFLREEGLALEDWETRPSPFAC